MPEGMAVLMDEGMVSRILKRMAHEIIESSRPLSDVVLVGICRRGVPLAAAIARNIRAVAGIALPQGQLDITHYRDDLSPQDALPKVSGATLPFDVQGKTVILVDDVIYTGRTARAAMDAVFDHGRPSGIRLAVLVDRGHREIPIRPDYVGKNVPTAKAQRIAVHVPDFDADTGVYLYGPGEGKR